MTPEAQRIAIAESLGWTQRTEGMMWSESLHRAAIVQGSHLESVRRKMKLPMDNGVMLPDWLTDLNAMHEAEKVLEPAQEDAFAAYLGDLTGGRQIDRGALRINATVKILFASAAHRAEAFLRATGRWTTES